MPPDNRNRPTGSGAAQQISEGARSGTTVPADADAPSHLRQLDVGRLSDVELRSAAQRWSRAARQGAGTVSPQLEIVTWAAAAARLELRRRSAAARLAAAAAEIERLGGG